MSKELEALERYGYHCNHYVNGEKDYKIIERTLNALEIIKELILEDLVFDDKEQEINFSFGISTLCIKIQDKEKYDLLKEVLL